MASPHMLPCALHRLHRTNTLRFVTHVFVQSACVVSLFYGTRDASFHCPHYTVHCVGPSRSSANGQLSAGHENQKSCDTRDDLRTCEYVVDMNDERVVSFSRPA